MKASHFFTHTLKEAPSDAEMVSHQLMMRAGMIRRIAGGIYSYMPLGLRSIRKIEAIVRQEMNAIGALELLLPALQPAELWQESERWTKYGAELLRLKDRHGRDYAIGPTHEEVITDIARKEIRSYRQMPVSFYQIQTKFRDEIRPRFGIMRAREFIMKDAYSFDTNEEGLKHSYQKMLEAYHRIFTRLGLVFRMVVADNGAIGGQQSHEFHLIADAGEDTLAYCPTSAYAANIDAAEALPAIAQRAQPNAALNKIATPGKTKCEDVAALLNVPLKQTVKSIVLAIHCVSASASASASVTPPPQIWLLLLRGDHSLNEVKVQKLVGRVHFRSATTAEIMAWFGTMPGYLGPIGTPKPVKVVADRTVANMSDFIVGANEANYHLTGVNWGRDLPEPIVADLRNVVAGDRSPDNQGVLAICRGIEVGHIFQLGTRYSTAMGATYLDASGQLQPMVMGCYGIGMTRLLSAAIEQNFDQRGMIWPQALAPFELVLCPIDYHHSETVREATDRLYATFVDQGVDLILDDRGERAGVMFADWELIGIPHRLVISKRSLVKHEVEYQHRRATQPTLLAIEQAADVITDKIRAAHHSRSMEEEARHILRTALLEEAPVTLKLAQRIKQRFAPLGGVALPPREQETLREPPDFE